MSRSLPLAEHLFLNLFVPQIAAKTPWLKASKNVSVSGQHVLKIYHTFPTQSREKPIQISRPLGLEGVSCNWSPAMVLQHLTMVGQGILEIIASARANQHYPHIITTAGVKPSPTVSAQEAEENFTSFLNTYSRETQQEVFNPAFRVAHPWFGSLSVGQWHAFTAMHHSVHIRQLKKMKKAGGF